MAFTVLYETTGAYTVSLVHSILEENAIDYRTVEHGISPVALGMPSDAASGTCVVRILVEEARLAEAKNLLCEHDIVCDVSDRLRKRCFDSLAVPLLRGESDNLERLAHYLQVNNKATVAAILADIHADAQGPPLLMRLFCHLLESDDHLTLTRLTRFLNDHAAPGMAPPALYELLPRLTRSVRRNLADMLGRLPSIRPEEMLVGLLRDEEQDVREAAIESLFSLTEQDLGYEPDDTEEARNAAVNKWEAWAKKRRSS